MDVDELFHPSLEAALMKLDPEDGEKMMDYFKTHALLTREKALLQASVREQKKLLVENAKLKKDIELLHLQLQDKQRRRTAKAALSLPPPPQTLSLAPRAPVHPLPSAAGVSTAPSPSSSSHKRIQRRRGNHRAHPVCPPLGAEPPVDVSRLDLRVGRILSVHRHPLAEMLSVQEVDLGENALRTVVSKLAGQTHLEELQGSLAVLLCNVKARKLKGVISQARLLWCCNSNEIMELLAPPPGAIPGDRVTFLNYPGEPDRELQSKQRVWEVLQPNLQVNNRGVANYKGCGFQVKGKGLCRAPSLTNGFIR
ncbi:aminoacyl tRNA synthase complex-interacting multifunctional protein 1 [Aulostomus maculatus]